MFQLSFSFRFCPKPSLNNQFHLKTNLLSFPSTKLHSHFSDLSYQKTHLTFCAELLPLSSPSVLITFMRILTFRNLCLQGKLSSNPLCAACYQNSLDPKCVVVVFKILFKILTERERERGNTSRGSERGRSRLPAEQGAPCGA